MTPSQPWIPKLFSRQWSVQPRIEKFFFHGVDPSSLIFFRIGFALSVLAFVWQYFQNDWISHYCITPSFHFTFPGLSWVKPWPGNVMYWHFVLMALFALGIGLGFYYRLCSFCFLIAFAHLFFIDPAYFENHYYLIVLLGFLLNLLGLHRKFSVDTLLRPRLRVETIPAWNLYLLRAQIAIVYLFGGISKINLDWLDGEPMRSWLHNKVHYPLIGPYLTSEFAAYFTSYGGLLFDLSVVPMLLWRKTRLYGFFLAVFFHLSNALLFRIGVFPWLMIVATTLFLDAAWPKEVAKALFGIRRLSPRECIHEPRHLVMASIGLYLCLQIALPLRHFLYPGDVSWTGEGHLFSWRMMLHRKLCRLRLIVKNPSTGDTWEVNPYAYLNHLQVEALRTPEYLRQFSQYLALRWKQEQGINVEVYADVEISLNGRPFKRLIDPHRNLASDLGSSDWILPR